MNYNYKIFIDAGADIDKSYLDNGLVEMLPMGYTVSGKVASWDGIGTNKTIKDFYQAQKDGETTQTTPLQQEDYNEFFEIKACHGIGILYISMSSVLSKSNFFAKEAKRQMLSKYGDVPFYIVDSLSATGGIGIIAERAVMNRQLGLSLEENAENLAMMSGRVHSWFYVQDLDYLRRTGRTSASKSFIGSLLGIKPILEISSDGVLRQINKSFGTKKACEILKELYVNNGCSDRTTSIYITHADDLQNASNLQTIIKNDYPNVSIKLQYLSPIIGSHSGVGTVALHHYAG